MSIKEIEIMIEEMKKSEDPLSIYLEGISKAQIYRDVYDATIDYNKLDDFVEDFTINLLEKYGDRVLTSDFCKEVINKIKTIKDISSNITLRYVLEGIMSIEKYRDHPILWDNIYKYSDDELNVSFIGYTISKRQGCIRALKNYIVVNEQMEQLKNELEEKNKEIERLNLKIEHYRYMPGGDGYEDSKKHFHELSNI
jgi:hypothetical protein